MNWWAEICIAVALAVLMVFLASVDAKAQQCGPTVELNESLSREYKEAVSSGGLTEADGKTVMLQVWTSKNGETWTIVLLRPDGVSCQMAAGEHWGDVEWKLPPQGEGS